MKAKSVCVPSFWTLSAGGLRYSPSVPEFSSRIRRRGKNRPHPLVRCYRGLIKHDPFPPSNTGKHTQVYILITMNIISLNVIKSVIQGQNYYSSIKSLFTLNYYVYISRFLFAFPPSVVHCVCVCFTICGVSLV